MKKILLLIILSFSAIASANITVVNSVDSKKTIRVTVTNDSDSPVHCRWRVSWFESLFSFKAHHGTLDVFPNSSEELEFINDPYSKVYKLKSHFDCL